MSHALQACSTRLIFFNAIAKKSKKKAKQNKFLVMEKNRKKDEFLKFRITEKEKVMIEERSKNCNKNMSEFARFMLLNGEVITITVEEKRILVGLANNINQLVKRFHQTNKEPDNLMIELQTILIHLKNAYRRST
jgi:hypothetical protein